MFCVACFVWVLSVPVLGVCVYQLVYCCALCSGCSRVVYKSLLGGCGKRFLVLGGVIFNVYLPLTVLNTTTLSFSNYKGSTPTSSSTNGVGIITAAAVLASLTQRVNKSGIRMSNLVGTNISPRLCRTNTNSISTVGGTSVIICGNIRLRKGVNTVFSGLRTRGGPAVQMDSNVPSRALLSFRRSNRGAGSPRV